MGFTAQVHFGSAKDFFASLLADLLGAIETLVDDVLAFVQYLVDGVVANAADIAGLMGAAGSVRSRSCPKSGRRSPGRRSPSSTSSPLSSPSRSR